MTVERIMRAAMGALLYFPNRRLLEAPAAAGLASEELRFRTEDGELLHGWWIPTAQATSAGHLLVFHGNAGNIGDRVAHAGVLAHAGFDVMLFDYRGYGKSSGKPDEEGTYRDARAALEALGAKARCAREHVIYLGESLGGAIAAQLAVSAPPRALILQSTFTSLREVARLHYPFIPRSLIPDAYPTIDRIGLIRSPVLVLHGDRDEIVPVAHGRALFAAAGGPKRLEIFPGLGHGDLLAAGPRYGAVIAQWIAGLDSQERAP